jgi:MFS family permease
MSWSQVTPQQRRTLIAAALGWMLDGFDVMLYATVVSYVMLDLGMSKPMAGFLNTLTLIASGMGGLIFGFIADRLGRKRALMLSILTYSVCSFASGLSTSIAMLAVFRFILGLGMGGEWNTGATLVAETWPTELRAKALAMVQSSFAIGFAAAALVAGLVLKFSNWRTVFFVGIAPALVILWIRRQVPESEMWKEHHRLAQESKPVAEAQRHYEESSFKRLFSPEFIKPTFVLLFVNFFGMFGWWGLFTWAPAFLSLPESQGGRGFGLAGTTTMLVVQQLVGMFPGYASFGWVADKLGRRKSFVLYLVIAAVLTPIYAMVRGTALILLLGIVVAFFGTGFFSGSSITGSEIFPTTLRARALGFTYPGARMLSSVAPFAIGWIWQTKGLTAAFFLCGASFLLAAIVATQLPETRGKALE